MIKKLQRILAASIMCATLYHSTYAATNTKKMYTNYAWNVAAIGTAGALVYGCYMQDKPLVYTWSLFSLGAFWIAEYKKNDYAEKSQRLGASLRTFLYDRTTTLRSQGQDFSQLSNLEALCGEAASASSSNKTTLWHELIARFNSPQLGMSVNSASGELRTENNDLSPVVNMINEGHAYTKKEEQYRCRERVFAMFMLFGVWTSIG